MGYWSYLHFVTLAIFPCTPTVLPCGLLNKAVPLTKSLNFVARVGSRRGYRYCTRAPAGAAPSELRSSMRHVALLQDLVAGKGEEADLLAEVSESVLHSNRDR